MAKKFKKEMTKQVELVLDGHKDTVRIVFSKILPFFLIIFQLADHIIQAQVDKLVKAK